VKKSSETERFLEPAPIAPTASAAQDETSSSLNSLPSSQIGFTQLLEDIIEDISSQKSTEPASKAPLTQSFSSTSNPAESHPTSIGRDDTNMVEVPPLRPAPEEPSQPQSALLVEAKSPSPRLESPFSTPTHEGGDSNAMPGIEEHEHALQDKEDSSTQPDLPTVHAEYSTVKPNIEALLVDHDYSNAVHEESAAQDAPHVEKPESCSSLPSEFESNKDSEETAHYEKKKPDQTTTQHEEPEAEHPEHFEPATSLPSEFESHEQVNKDSEVIPHPENKDPDHTTTTNSGTTHQEVMPAENAASKSAPDQAHFPAIKGRSASQTFRERPASKARQAFAYTPIKSDGTGMPTIHNKSPIQPFELSPPKASLFSPIKILSAENPSSSTTTSANATAKRAKSTKASKATPSKAAEAESSSTRTTTKASSVSKAASLKDKFSESEEEESTPRYARHTRKKGAPKELTSQVSIGNLLSSGLLAVGDQLEYKGQRAIIKRAGWLETKHTSHPTINDWLLEAHAAAEGSGSNLDISEKGVEWQEISVIHVDPRSGEPILANNKGVAGTLDNYAETWRQLLEPELLEAQTTQRKRQLSKYIDEVSDDSNDEEQAFSPPPSKRAKDTARMVSKSTSAASSTNSAKATAKLTATTSETTPSRPLPASATPTATSSAKAKAATAAKATSSSSTASQSTHPKSAVKSSTSSMEVDNEEVPKPKSKKTKYTAATGATTSSKTSSLKSNSPAVPKSPSIVMEVDDEEEQEEEEEVLKPTKAKRTKSTATSSAISVDTSPLTSKTRSPVAVGGSAKAASSSKSPSHLSRAAKASGAKGAAHGMPIILSSGLSSAMSRSLASVISTLGGKLESSFTDSVTHLVVSTDERGQAARTYKYLEAIVRGVYIVTTEWPVASLAAHSYQKPSNFIVKGDHAFHGGPTQSVAHLEHKNTPHKLLFEGLEVCLHGAFDNPNQLNGSQVKHLLQLGGATVHQTGGKSKKTPQAACSNLDSAILVCDADTTPDEADALVLRTGKSPITLLWILDSISQFKRADISSYYIVEPDDHDSESSMAW
jgi:hypothetical protein